ncbi:DUF4199 domain-containing protein [Aureitalea marina]|uniref:DUF4199 domain-containing protein n=1 Tax=Aureitalea marina TaxID=930804 RepID=A0A2S7KRM9_9FLAO|nr:DUF4199 domain-containing protein [Aureitalea marina]PQB05257.1 hypothetical protein BST85_10445 [Aureitalea marina]
MKRTSIRFGLYGALTICILFLASWTLGKGLSYDAQEVLGYSSMIISLSFVFFGIRYFRDKENNGQLNFKQALTIGLLISLLTALAFGLLDVIYVKYINPEFMDDYYARSLAQLQESLPADEFEIQKAQLESQKEFWMNPMMNFVIMFLTVFVIGSIITLISGLILKTNSNNA